MSAFDVIALIIVIWFCFQGQVADWWRSRSKPVSKPQARRRRVTMAPCPINANHDTSPFSSTQDLWCHDCRLFHPWPLKPGQKPLVTDSRDRGIA